MLLAPLWCAAAFLFNLISSLPGPAWAWSAIVSMLIALLGAALLFAAKLPLYRQRRFFTLGGRSVPESHRHLYYWGCRLSFTGGIVMFLLWLASILWK